MPDVPVLDTPRLILRAHRLDDFADLAAMWGDPAVTRHIGGKPSAPAESWSRLHRYRGHWALLGYGFWAVEERETGRYVGDLGLADFHRGLDHPFNDAPEAGWALAPWSHGRGYASEALAAVLAWGEARFGSPKVWCIIDPDNAPSIRVAEKAGFVLHGRTALQGEPTLLLARGA
ncbi:GNAT family N-acetyltransferase [Caulobacter sp. KR2-114]|uniref:GNAT family N-acetyltransferase n=1 Tax=Caulobacter sp. KR2-114 TaxID=3400912 RepID=UPI003C1089BD